MTDVSDDIPHGTSAGYQRHKCRCPACRGAEIERQRAWRQRLREGKVRHRPDHSVCVPVRVRGKVYPSISMAAADLGIAPASVSHQLRKYGSGDRAGLGASAPRRQALNNAKPCRIHGREFPSIAAAARYMGVSTPHLYRSLARGLSETYAQYLLRRLMEADARPRVAA